MKTIVLKTNIMCGSCVAKVTPIFNEALGVGNWKVDTLNPKKVLTINTDALDESEAIEAVQKAGYRAEELDKAII